MSFFCKSNKMDLLAFHCSFILEAYRTTLVLRNRNGKFILAPTVGSLVHTTHPHTATFAALVLVLPQRRTEAWRFINHLSAPSDSSINDFIDPRDFSLQYATIDAPIKICNTLGNGALMAKVELKNTFRLCPVRPEDWHLLGIHWRGKYYIDNSLPFGLRSAPYLFNMAADGVDFPTLLQRQ